MPAQVRKNGRKGALAETRDAATRGTGTSPAASRNAPAIGELAGYTLLLAIATTILYLPIAHHPFINFDDGTYIAANPNIENGITPAMVKWAAVSFYAANWHPITWLAHAANIELFGTDPVGHHFVSLLLHIANVVLLFVATAFATRAVARSFLLAALFAVHPLNVESVAWAAELKNLLCTFFFLLAIGAYVWYARKPHASRYGVVFVLFALGLAAKPMVITLPLVLLLLDFWPLRRIRGLNPGGNAPEVPAEFPQASLPQLALEKLPLLALSAVSAWITIRAQTEGQATTMIHVPLEVRLENALVSYATYMEKALAPSHLGLFYPFPMSGIPVWKIILSAGVLAAITAVVAGWGRQRGYLVAGWLWFLGTLVPVIGILQVGAQARADRYAYIPMIGLLVMAVWAAADFATAKKAHVAFRVVPALTVFAMFVAVTSRQISYWRSSSDLWAHTLAVTEDNALAEHNLSGALIQTGHTDEALPHLLRAVTLDPGDLASRVNLGNSYAAQGRHQEALREFRIVAEKTKDPKLLFPACVNAGYSYLKLGDLQNAEAAYQLALRISPNNASALAGMKSVERARAVAPTGPAH